MENNIIWTFFVLDFDGTYDNEPNDVYGIRPSVYLVPEERLVDVQKCAFNAGQMFHKEKTNYIGGCFENLMEELKIPYKFVGYLDITFGERKVDYLSDSIPREVV